MQVYGIRQIIERPDSDRSCSYLIFWLTAVTGRPCWSRAADELRPRNGYGYGYEYMEFRGDDYAALLGCGGSFRVPSSEFQARGRPPAG